MKVSLDGKFSCNVCSFVTREETDIDMHIDIHLKNLVNKKTTEDTIKECNKCNKKFTTSSSLRKHNLRRHESVIPKQISSPAWNFAEKGDGFAACNYCPKRFNTKGGNTSNILNHVKRKHVKQIEEYNKTKFTMQDNLI